jgi:hypothetical protein
VGAIEAYLAVIGFFVREVAEDLCNLLILLEIIDTLYDIPC